MFVIVMPSYETLVLQKTRAKLLITLSALLTLRTGKNWTRDQRSV